MLQSERTIQFWNEYHEQNKSKEWIFQSSVDLLEVLRQQCPTTSSPKLRILEIGCGTSSLTRDLWKHIISGNENNGHRQYVHAIATDVSSTCIQLLRERDAVILENNDKSNGNILEYRTLDVINPSNEIPASFSCHVVLDKGCLDTFLFRSRNRGANNSYSTMLKKLLDNIWSWLTDDGVYLIISPRAKLKAVRDYAGFRTVRQHALANLSKGDLVNEEKNPSPGYIHVCQKNPYYKIGETPAFGGVVEEKDTPSEDAKCSKCGITFAGLRKGEVLDGRGTIFWIRQWKGHCQHCKH